MEYKRIMKIIKNNIDYEKALKRAEQLVALDPEPNTPEADELEVLSLLIEKYEDKVFPLDMPDPVEAIKFRMQQRDFVQKDLVPYIGSASKVSEVLNRKRPLTLTMIRKLYHDFGIPAEVLLQEKQDAPLEDTTGLDWARFPVRELINNGWINFSGNVNRIKEHSEELMREFFRGISLEHLQTGLCRQTIRSVAVLDEYALMAWKAQVLKLAKKQPLKNNYQKGIVNKAFIHDLVKLSTMQDGPKLAQEYLGNYGIHLVFLKHLSKTLLDGAVMFDENGAPVIAMTLRYSRIDNFWFTLAHELAHIHLHLDKDGSICIIDDFKADENEVEKKTNQFAQDAIIPEMKWKTIKEVIDDNSINNIALNHRLHPAILAGRLRYETGDYTLFPSIISNEVNREKLFSSF